MDSLLTKGITYGALDSTLLALGFQEKTYETHRLYEKKEAVAIIVLPRNIEMDKPAYAVHLLTARHTVSGKGIMGELEFEELLAASHESKRHLIVTANGHTASRSRQRKSHVSVSTPAEAH